MIWTADQLIQWCKNKGMFPGRTEYKPDTYIRVHLQERWGSAGINIVEVTVGGKEVKLIRFKPVPTRRRVLSRNQARQDNIEACVGSLPVLTIV